MVRISVEAPGLPEAQTVELARGETLVVGREPASPRDPAVRAVAIASASVSATHVTLHRDDDGVRIEDADSRNGSWLRLPPKHGVTVAGAVDELTLRLAAAPARDDADEDPADATWSAPAHFAPAIAAAVSAWLRQVGVPATVSLRDDARAEPRAPERDAPGELPLASGHTLAVAAAGTVDARWPRLLGRLWRYVERQNGVFRSEQLARSDGLILASRAIRAAHRQVVEAAQRGLRVLLIGPSGAGKEGLARAYHRHAKRKGAFVALNCAMFSKELLRAELFGVEKHAFTNVERSVGAVERAQRGTLFLDEIGEMSEDVQPMLLRFLDRGEYSRMGSYGQALTVDVGIIAATNRDLRRQVTDGKFREDLWYRLSSIVVEVPPLAERADDVAAFLDGYQVSPGLTAAAALDDESHALVRAHGWGGNFRELVNFAERLPRATQPGSIDAAACRRALAQGALVPPPTRAAATAPAPDGVDWPALASEAVGAFAADNGGAPSNWRDIQKYLEKYVKPLLFAHLSGAAALATVDDALARASRLDADRATAQSQLKQYFGRYRRG